jgi:hypothetical protein
MPTPPRLIPLLAQFDFGRESLAERLVGLTDDEYLWEPVPGCWSIRPRTDGPAPLATELVGAGHWGRDRSPDNPEPAPFTTLAWRLSHLNEMLTLRADHMSGTHTITRATYAFSGTAIGALAAYHEAASAWRDVLTGAAEADLDEVGRSTYPYGSDPDVPFLQTVWWMNEELLHHRGEIALLRDLYRQRDELRSTR